MDPTEGVQYIEPACDEEEVDHIYKLTTQDEDWINPRAEGVLCWEKDSEFFSDFDGELENWQGQSREVLALQCLRVTRNFCCISFEVRDLPYFGDLGNIKEFLCAFKADFPKGCRLWAVNLTLHGTPTHWWDTHGKELHNWEECRDKMLLQFEAQAVR